MEERWPAESADVVGGVPWRVSDDDPNVDGEKMKCEATEPRAEVLNEEEKGWLDEERVPRAFSVKGSDFEQHGSGMHGFSIGTGETNSEACPAAPANATAPCFACDAAPWWPIQHYPRLQPVLPAPHS